MPFDAHLKRGLLKRQPPNFKQIETQAIRAKKDVHTARSVLTTDAEWAATIAYHAMHVMEAAIKRKHPQFHFDFARASRRRQ